MTRRRRVAVVHPVPVWHGGAEVVALWTLQALAREHAVTLVSYGAPPDFEALNRRFGTSLARGDVGWLEIPIPAAAFRFRGPFDILWRCLTMQYCRRLGERFDLFVSTFYEMDFGRPGLQYCHCPMYAAAWSGVLGEGSWARRGAWRAYRRLVGAVTGFEPERMRRNLTLANSDWTGRELVAAYGGRVRTVYPPAQGAERPLPWAEREAGFVCIGRLVPEKRFDAVIRILSRVRERAGDVHLHLVVSAPDPSCRRQVEALVAARADWVRLEWNLSRQQVASLCGAHKYGIHAREGEHFGLAPAEIAASGALPFVHDSGGQVEIAQDPRLRYADEAEAVEKICALLADESAASALASELAARAAAFAPPRFMAEMRDAVSSCLAEAGASAAAR